MSKELRIEFERVPNSQSFQSFSDWMEATIGGLDTTIYALSIGCGLGRSTLWNLSHTQKDAGPRVRNALRTSLGITAPELDRLLPPSTPKPLAQRSCLTCRDAFFP